MYKRYYIMLFDENKKAAGHIKMELTEKKLIIAIYSKDLKNTGKDEYYLYLSEKGAKSVMLGKINNLKFMEISGSTLAKMQICPENIYNVYITDVSERLVLSGNLDNDLSIVSFKEKLNSEAQSTPNSITFSSENSDENANFQSRILSNEAVEHHAEECEDECPFECGDLGFNWQEVESYEFPLYDIMQTLVKTSDVLNFVWHYGFYLLGINKNDKNTIALGVPCYHGIDPHPFPYLHAISIWVPENNCTSVYGDFGFWVIGIDLNINKYFSLM